MCVYSINVLLIIGGFEVYLGFLELLVVWEKYEEFCVFMVMVFVIVFNNVLGFDFSIGVDIVLNIIIDICDCIK